MIGASMPSIPNQHQHYRWINEDLNQLTSVRERTGINRLLSKLFACLFSAQFKPVLRFRIYHELILLKFFPFRVIGVILFERTKQKYTVEIHPGAQIGKGFLIVHLGNIVIGKKAVIGDYVKINSGVTLGEKKGPGNPIIGSNVWIGPGAKILGDICIGEKSIIGANAVVLDSCSNNSILVGIPARKVGSVE